MCIRNIECYNMQDVGVYMYDCMIVDVYCT